MGKVVKICWNWKIMRKYLEAYCTPLLVRIMRIRYVNTVRKKKNYRISGSKQNLWGGAAELGGGSVI